MGKKQAAVFRPQHRAQRGTVQLEQLVSVSVIAVAGVVGFATLGSGFFDAIADRSESAPTAPHRAPFAVSTQAAVGDVLAHTVDLTKVEPSLLRIATEFRPMSVTQSVAKEALVAAGLEEGKRRVFPGLLRPNGLSAVAYRNVLTKWAEMSPAPPPPATALSEIDDEIEGAKATLREIIELANAPIPGDFAALNAVIDRLSAATSRVYDFQRVLPEKSIQVLRERRTALDSLKARIRDGKYSGSLEATNRFDSTRTTATAFLNDDRWGAAARKVETDRAEALVEYDRLQSTVATLAESIAAGDFPQARELLKLLEKDFSSDPGTNVFRQNVSRTVDALASNDARLEPSVIAALRGEEDSAAQTLYRYLESFDGRRSLLADRVYGVRSPVGEAKLYFRSEVRQRTDRVREAARQLPSSLSDIAGDINATMFRFEDAVSQGEPTRALEIVNDFESRIFDELRSRTGPFDRTLSPDDINAIENVAVGLHKGVDELRYAAVTASPRFKSWDTPFPNRTKSVDVRVEEGTPRGDFGIVGEGLPDVFKAFGEGVLTNLRLKFVGSLFDRNRTDAGSLERPFEIVPSARKEDVIRVVEVLLQQVVRGTTNNALNTFDNAFRRLVQPNPLLEPMREDIERFSDLFARGRAAGSDPMRVVDDRGVPVDLERAATRMDKELDTRSGE